MRVLGFRNLGDWLAKGRQAGKDAAGQDAVTGERKWNIIVLD